MGNVVIGVLKNDETISELSFFIACKKSVCKSAENLITVARLFNESMHMLWPGGIKYDNTVYCFLLLTQSHI